MSKATLEKFYQAFQNLDASTMAECYHPDVRFSDPVFRDLDFEQVKGMWEMLIERSDGNLVIDFHSVIGDDAVAQCIWEAEYKFSKTGNPVHNIIHATMKFKEGLIIQHTDEFDFWRWARMALGPMGVVLGWTPFVKNKVRKMANASLSKHLHR